MRIWDIKPNRLCRQHLLGEHRELHGIWNIIAVREGKNEGKNGKRKIGYSRHPETQRWRGKLMALFLRHEALVREMTRRGYRHHSALDPSLASGKAKQDVFLDTIEKQEELLKNKPCACLLSPP